MAESAQSAQFAQTVENSHAFFNVPILFQVFGIICTMAAEQLLSHTGNDLLANGMLAGVLLLGTILTALIKADYRRQAASKPQGNLLKGIDN